VAPLSPPRTRAATAAAAAAASLSTPFPEEGDADAAAPPPPPRARAERALYPQLTCVLDFSPALRTRDALLCAALGCLSAALLFCFRHVSARAAALPPLGAAAAAALCGALVAAAAAAATLEAAAQAVLLSPEAASDGDSLFADADALRVHYKQRRPAAGAPPPRRVIACMHGMGANESSWTLRGALDGLAQRAAAVAIAHDAPGFGLTHRTRRISDYGLRRSARVANALVTAVAAAEARKQGRGKAAAPGGAAAAPTATPVPALQRVLVGHSLGGLLAVRAAEAAALAGAPYDALVLVAPAVIATGAPANGAAAAGAAPAGAPAADVAAAAGEASPSAPLLPAAPPARARALFWPLRVLRAALLAPLQLLLLALLSAAAPLALVSLRSAVRSAPFWRAGLRGAYVDKAQVDAQLVDAYRRPAAVHGWDAGMLRFVASRILPGGPGDILRDAMRDCAFRAPPPTTSAAAALAALVAAGTPVLIVHGDGDALVPLRNSIALAARCAPPAASASASVPGVRLHVLRGVGHSPQEEAPAAFLDAVAHFLQHSLGGGVSASEAA
jgi:pimeloyl-ACP methyl ester carboxylesterase